MTDHDPAVIGGRYELGELLGRGGMAEVRKGLDRRLGRVVAIKRLRTDLASDSTFQARFKREAQSSASLNHPTIVAVYDTGEEPAADGSGISQPYIVMEYVAGRTLREVLREGRKILPERALEISAGVLAALDYSHRAGIIHRDIKPGNVMLTPSGDVKVMDFGIARAISDASSTMTQTAAVVGTAQYLSPEQARGETVDSRSDVYSAGCLLYELLTGRPPFVGDSPVAVAYQHVREQADPPSDHDTSIPPELDMIVMKSLAKRLEDRYQSAAAMRSDIDRYLAGRPVEAEAVPPVPEPSTVVAAAPMPPTPATPAAAATPPEDDEESGPRRGLIVALVGLLLALVAGGFIIWPTLFPSDPDQEQVPNLSRLTEDQARAEIAEAGLRVGEIKREATDLVPIDMVIPDTQDPTTGSYADVGSPVSFTVSLGPENGDVPDLSGKNEAAARQAVTDAGFVVGDVGEAAHNNVPEGQVIPDSQRPAPGESVKLDSTISFDLSTGPEQVTIPTDLVGSKRPAAVQRLRDLNLKPRAQSEDSDEAAGTVLRTDPPAGTSVDIDSQVTVFYSDGPNKVPDVIGDTEAEATAEIEAAGFVPKVFTSADTTEAAGTVIAQDPVGGTPHNSEGFVNITVSTYSPTAPPPATTPPATPTEPADPADRDGSQGPDALATTPSAGRSSGRAGRRTPAP